MTERDTQRATRNTQHPLGLALSVRESIGFRGSLELAQEAERLGYRSLWTAEVGGIVKGICRGTSFMGVVPAEQFTVAASSGD